MFALVLAAGVLACAGPASAAKAMEIDKNVKKALNDLYEKSASARALGDKAIAVLVFPKIVKGGFLVGGQHGEGALLKNGKTSGYYKTIQVSYGLQLGVQKYGYAMFFMTEKAIEWIDKSDGWEVGVGPTIVVMETGKSTSKTTTTMQSDIYAFFFNQKGVMGGLGLQGTKISRIKK